MSETTIILTTHDRPAMLGVALASAVGTGARVIVVDDASATDAARHLAAEHGVDYVRHDAPVGFIRARVAALAEVTSEYVAFLDDDDMLGADWLALSIAKMAEGYDVVSASYWETDSALSPTRTRILAVPTMARLLGGHCPINDGALVRRSVLEGVTWHVERDTVAMLSLWLDLFERGARFGVVEAPCWYHRLHRGNMSAALPEQDAAWRAEAIAEHRPVPA